MTRCWFSLAVVAVLMGATVRAATDEQMRQATIVVYNARDPRSQTLAEYYRKAREIPEENVIALSTGIAETMTREQYNKQIAEPLREALIKRGFWEADSVTSGPVKVTKVRFCVLMRGIPLKISRDGTILDAPPGLQDPFKPRNEAAVDSELAALGLGEYPLCGPINNPYYRSYLPILESHMPAGFMIVARLDAPLGSEVERMITDSLAAENGGLWGGAYLDARGLKSGPYMRGDEWLASSASSLRKAGVPVFLEKRGPTFPEAFKPDDMVFYLGWYSANVDGPFKSESFRFRPGAIAVHLHSFSGQTVRDPTKRWVGPLLSRGAAATLGNVFEPYLELTPHFDILTDRLLNGFTFGEAAYMSLPAISWMTSVIGDPLYRPYRTWADVVAGLELQTNPFMEYRDLLRKYGPESTKVGGQLRSLAERAQVPGLMEGAADIALSAGDINGSISDLDAAIGMGKTTDQQFVAFYEKVAVMLQNGKRSEAKAALQEGLRSFSETDQINFIAGLLAELQKGQ